MTKIDGLDGFLQSYPPAIIDLSHALIDIILDARPDFAPSVKHGWRAINFHHKKAGYVCGVFPHDDRVSLLFEQGALLSDPHDLLDGDARQIRYMRFRPGDDIAPNVIGLYLMEAIALKA